jgi:hypothetical protein
VLNSGAVAALYALSARGFSLPHNPVKKCFMAVVDSVERRRNAGYKKKNESQCGEQEKSEVGS